jgi:hypothetical protein
MKVQTVVVLAIATAIVTTLLFIPKLLSGESRHLPYLVETAYAKGEAKEAPEVHYCSCVTYLRTLIPSLPLVDAKHFKDFPRATPQVGGVAIFYYPTSGEYHVGYIAKLNDSGFLLKEANYEPCKVSTRLVEWNDPRLVGFWVSP